MVFFFNVKKQTNRQQSKKANKHATKQLNSQTNRADFTDCTPSVCPPCFLMCTWKDKSTENRETEFDVHYHIRSVRRLSVRMFCYLSFTEIHRLSIGQILEDFCRLRNVVIKLTKGRSFIVGVLLTLHAVQTEDEADEVLQ